MIWHEWPYPAEGPTREIHIVPEQERKRHRPQDCWCDPEVGVRDGVPVFRHKLMWINNSLERIRHPA